MIEFKLNIVKWSTKILKAIMVGYNSSKFWKFTHLDALKIALCRFINIELILTYWCCDCVKNLGTYQPIIQALLPTDLFPQTSSFLTVCLV